MTNDNRKRKTYGARDDVDVKVYGAKAGKPSAEVIVHAHKRRMSQPAGVTKRRRVGTRKLMNNWVTAQKGGHAKPEEKPASGPSDALYRALLNAPFHAKQVMGPNYQRAKLNTGYGAMPSRLIEQRSVVEVTVPPSGACNIFVLPSLLFMCLSEDNDGTPINVFNKWDNTGLTDHRPAQGIDTQFSGVSAGRCLSMGAEIISTENITAAKGQIGAVSFPSDPTGLNGKSGGGGTGGGVSQSSMQDLANFEGAVVGRAVEGVHCYWKPEENSMGIAKIGVATAPNVSAYLPVEWRYDRFSPIGWTKLGDRASTIDAGAVTDYCDFQAIPLGQTNPMCQNLLYMMPGLFFRIEGATVGAIYKMTVVQHWEVYDYKIGADRSRGHDGVRTSAHRGLVGTITHDVEAAFHEVEHVAGEALHAGEKVGGFLETAAKDVGTVVKYGALIASLA